MIEFEKIYNELYQKIFNYCYKRVNNFDSANDITSETFLKVFLNLDKFKWKGIPVINWIYRIAINEVNLYYRSRKYRPTILLETYGEISALLGEGYTKYPQG